MGSDRDGTNTRLRDPNLTRVMKGGVCFVHPVTGCISAGDLPWLYDAVDSLRDCANDVDVQLSRSTAPAYRAMPRVNDHSIAERSLAALGVFEEALERSTTPFMADAESPTYVDLAIFCELFELAEPTNVPDFAARFELPKLGAFLEMMAQRPRIAAYIRSPRRIPRYQRPGYTYCTGKFSPAPMSA